MSDLFADIKQQVGSLKPSIVLPEGTDERVLEAAVKLATDNIVEPIVIGNKDEIASLADKLNLIIADLTIYDPETYPHLDEMVDALVARRKVRKRKSLHESY